MTYMLGEPNNGYGEEMTVKVRSGGASSFTSFEQDTNTFYVNANKLLDYFVGDYNIIVSAYRDHNGYEEKHTKSFNLKVLPAE